MKRLSRGALPSLTALAMGLPGMASATAQLGGVIGASFVPNTGSCNKTVNVPLTTLQDTLNLNLTAACPAGASGNVIGDLKGSAASGAIGLKLVATGTGIAAAQVSLVDQWFIMPPTGTPAGLYSIPATLHIDGSAGGTAILGTYLSYTMSLFDYGQGNSQLAGNGSVTTAGPYSQSFSAPFSINVTNAYGGGLKAKIEVSEQLTVQNLQNGTIDFYNTAFASLSLPPGWTAVTSSGLPVTSVPEPAAALLMLLGVGALSARRFSRAR